MEHGSVLETCPHRRLCATTSVSTTDVTMATAAHRRTRASKGSVCSLIPRNALAWYTYRHHVRDRTSHFLTHFESLFLTFSGLIFRRIWLAATVPVSRSALAGDALGEGLRADPLPNDLQARQTELRKSASNPPLPVTFGLF